MVTQRSEILTSAKTVKLAPGLSDRTLDATLRLVAFSAYPMELLTPDEPRPDHWTRLGMGDLLGVMGWERVGLGGAGAGRICTTRDKVAPWPSLAPAAMREKNRRVS
jgi:hypothetical protein